MLVLSGAMINFKFFCGKSQKRRYMQRDQVVFTGRQFAPCLAFKVAEPAVFACTLAAVIQCMHKD